MRQVVLIIGIWLALPIAARAEDENPVGQCMLELVLKSAPTKQTAVSLSEYIANKCMELYPPLDCPPTVGEPMCSKIHSDTVASARELTRATAYDLIVTMRRNSGSHPRPH